MYGQSMPRVDHFKGILFDSGDTLVRPTGGRWNPRYDFESVLLRYFPDIKGDAFPEAFAAGQRMLDAAPRTADRAEYHRVILRVLDIADPPQNLLRELEQPADKPPLEPFPETRRVLDELREQGILMAVVSDNWPELDDIFQQLGLRDYFQAFVISAVIGCRKPDPRMYRAGSDGLGLPPVDCLFVDDDPLLVDAAIELGYQGVVIDRGSPGSGRIASLDELIRPRFRL